MTNETSLRSQSSIFQILQEMFQKATPTVRSLHNLFGMQEDANYIQILNQEYKLSLIV